MDFHFSPPQNTDAPPWAEAKEDAWRLLKRILKIPSSHLTQSPGLKLIHTRQIQVIEGLG